MPSIAFFIAATGVPANDNHERLPRAFADGGWDVTLFAHNAIGLSPDGLDAIDMGGQRLSLEVFDRIWLLGFGPRESFLDRMQMLSTLDQTRFVNPVDAYVYMHSKCHFTLRARRAEGVRQPETFAAADPARLLEVIDQGGEWIAKPTAASYGRGVFRLSPNDPNRRAILDHLTEGATTYCIVQRYVEEAEHHEKRVLVAVNRIVGVYGKTLPRDDHRGNLAAGSQPCEAALSTDESHLAGSVIEVLAESRIKFATIDIAHPYVLEVNVVNPGWLATYDALTGADLAPDVVSALQCAPLA